MSIQAQVNYHIKSNEPQAFEFDVEGVIGNIIAPELVNTEVTVRDIREGAFDLDFNRDGIRFLNTPSEIQHFKPTRDWETTYDNELRTLLKKEIDAQEVIIFDHTIRIDDPNAARKPARNVHNDYSEMGAKQRLIDLVGPERAKAFHEGEFGFVNVWRPIEHTIRSSPLGFIRPDSIKPEDWMTIDLIYPDRHGQILGVSSNTNHEWFYLSHMTPDEVAIFNIYDNSGRPYLAHSALDIRDNTLSNLPRQSIESRTLVRYK